MTTQELPVPEEFRVNQATLEYLKLHIESEVRDRLLKWIGLPFGGAGLIAVVIGMFWYLPDKMATTIQTNPRVEEVIRSSATTFLQPENEGGRFIAARLRSHVATAVNEYLGSDDGRAQVNKQMGEQVGKYFEDQARAQRLIGDYFASDAGKAAIAKAIDLKLDSPEVKRTIQESIDKALEPALGALMQDLRSNSEKTILSTGALAMEHDTMEKEGYVKLTEFIRRERERPADQVHPLLMTLTAGGTVRYDAGACASYCRELARALADRFVGTLVNDADGRYLGLLPPTAFDQTGSEPTARELIERINAVDLEHVKTLLEKLRGGATASVSETATLAKSLRAPLWKRLAGKDQTVAVLTADGRLRGVTSRPRLIDAVLSPGG